MKFLLLSILSLLFFSNCATQSSHPKLVGAPCEGCEAVLEYDKQQIKSIDTISLFHSTTYPLRISGTIYKADGKTPAAGVVLYIYHTNEKGIYPSNGNEKNWARRHGHLRAWLKTDEAGQYTFYTGKPASYPGRTIAAHIHPTILEPNGRYYYVEDYYFADDPYLTKRELHPQSPRGGTKGVLSLKQEAELWVGKRDFILGKHIPNYELN